MKILMVSMFSNHFFNWTEQLRNSGHEIYWIDVFDSNTYVSKIDFVDQIIGWRYKWNYPGRYWIKKELPKLNRTINLLNQRDLVELVEDKLKEIQPDVVQSFVLFSAGYPILNLMGKYPRIKWIYSAWGNDLYFMQQFPNELDKIIKTLPHFDYMFADCDRDSIIAEKLGFKGRYLGTFPGGGGYDINYWKKYTREFTKRNIILIKGYQGELGRSRFVIKAISDLKEMLQDFQIVIFGSSEELFEDIVETGVDSWLNVRINKNITHKEVMKLMGKTKIYIGNCISDGMPNTLLEAIVMEAFPIQSNPGGATAEIIKHKINGLLIENSENEKEIADHIKKSLNNSKMMQDAIEYNNKFVKPKLDREFISRQVNQRYQYVEEQVKNSSC
jgi:glycosyltransferase involved in cell wall biosynthesis